MATEALGDDADLLDPLFDDGRPLLFIVGGSVLLAGAFLIFMAATGELLPQDVHYLGMDADDLCSYADCRIVEFMIHDRAAFGGALLGLGVLYTWLTAFPLARREAWAWWTWLISGSVGFLTFLAYLGYGYLDTWHGIVTAALLPVFVVGMWRTWRTLVPGSSVRSLTAGPGWNGHRDRFSAGRALLLLGAAATAASGLVILRVGVGDTFVSEDLEFMQLTAAQLRAIDTRLVPLLAHDRAGFGGGVLTLGLTTALCLWCSRPSRHLHQAIALAGVGSLGAALVTHVIVGYTDTLHLLPPVAAGGCLLLGLALEHPGTRSSLDDP